MKDFFSDIVNQIWTLLGMFGMWICLEGTAKTIIGYCTIGSFLLWIITFSLRNPKE